MIYSVNNNTAYNYSKYIARPKWQFNIFKIVAPVLQKNNVRNSETKSAVMHNVFQKTEQTTRAQLTTNKCKTYVKINNSKVIGSISTHQRFINKQCFECKQLLCYRSDLAFFNLRTYFSNILKAIHNCWIAARNNKRVLFIYGNEQTDELKVQIMNHSLIKQYVRQTLPQVNFEQVLTSADYAKSSNDEISKNSQNNKLSYYKKEQSKQHLTYAPTLSEEKQKQKFKTEQKTVVNAFDHLVSFLKLTNVSFNKLAPVTEENPQTSAYFSSIAPFVTQSKNSIIQKHKPNLQKLIGQNNKINKLNALAIHAASRQTAYSVNPSNVFIANTKAAFKNIYNLLHVFKFTDFVNTNQCSSYAGQNATFKFFQNKQTQTTHAQSKRKCEQHINISNQLINTLGQANVNSSLVYGGKTRQAAISKYYKIRQKTTQHLNFNKKTTINLPLINGLFNIVSQPLINYKFNLNSPINKTFTAGLLEQQQSVQALIAHNSQWKNKKLKLTNYYAQLARTPSFWINKQNFKNKHFTLTKLQEKQIYSSEQNARVKKKQIAKSGAWLKKRYVYRFYSTNNALSKIITLFGKFKKQNRLTLTKIKGKQIKKTKIKSLLTSNANLIRQKYKKNNVLISEQPKPRPKILSALNPLRLTQAKLYSLRNYYKSLLINNSIKYINNFAKNAWLKQAHLIFFVNAEQQYGLVNQAKRLQIPTIGIVGTGTNDRLGRPDFKSQMLDHNVNIPIIGNAHSIFFVTSLLHVLINVFAKANTLVACSPCLAFAQLRSKKRQLLPRAPTFSYNRRRKKASFLQRKAKTTENFCSP